MQLGKPEALGVLDHHDARLRNIDADLDHRRRDEDLRLSLPRRRPSRRPCRGFSSCRGRGRPCSPKTPLQMRRSALARRRHRAPRFPRRADRPRRRGRPPRLRARSRAISSSMRSSGKARVSIGCRPAGFSVQGRDIHVAEISEHQRARDRRRGHDENIGRGSLLSPSAKR